jgi:hypothetical protein
MGQTESEVNELRELFFHEDDHAKDRTDWFFIGNAILIEGLFSAPTAPAKVAVAVLALLAALIWLGTCVRQHYNLFDLREKYKERSLLFKEIQDRRIQKDKKNKLRRVALASRALLIWLPLLFTIFWLLGVTWALHGVSTSPAP